MTVLHIDATAGCAGDMLLAALVDAGAAPAAVDAAVAAMLPGASVSFTEVQRGGLRARHATVVAPPASPYHSWRDLRPALVDALTGSVAERAVAVFTRLAEAEAHVHGIPVADVHFHEVGAWDSVCDVVGSVAALADLGPRQVTATGVAVGSGRVRTEHGELPVPPPATAEILARAGIPVEPGPARFEACTPTGAALLAELVDDWVPGPQLRATRVGMGAGSADPAGFANVTRVFVGDDVAVGVRPGRAVLLSTNVDDIDARLWPGVQRQLLAAGASDAWLTDIHMKKGRPATTLSVLCSPESHTTVAGLIMSLTPAIGMRVHEVGKIAADRSERTVTVLGQRVRVKVASWEGRVVNVQPEWEDVAAAAAVTGLAEKELLARAHAAAESLWPAPQEE